MSNDPKKNDQRPNGNNNNENDIKGRRILFLVLAALIATLLINTLYTSISKSYLTEVRYDEFLTMLDNGEISELEFQSDDRVVYAKKSDTDSSGAAKKLYYTGLIPNQDTTALTDKLDEKGVKYNRELPQETSPIVSFVVTWLLPVIIMYGLFSLLMRSMSKRMGGMGGLGGIGESKAKVYMEKQTGVTFADVAGEDEAKESLVEIIDFLHNPQKYAAIGAKLPKGALLVGPPGTGKTLLAKAVAGEANVPFFSISGSDFVEMFVGVGASRVRDLFQQAAKVAPAIIFIDEIDGFDSSKGVVILAATNRPEILDKALLRAGRFDRRIIVDRPNLQGRYQTLRVHTKNIKLAEDVDLHKIAQATAGAVGADLANLVNEAALRAVRLGRKTVNQQDLLVSFETVIAGTEKKGTVLTDMEKRIVSYHEVGHALVAALQKHTQPVSKITIVPHTSGALGYTMQMPEEEKFLSSREELLVELQTLLGGRAAEQVVFGISTTGAANDIERATDLARKMVTQYGMSEKFGLMALSTVQSQYLDGAATMNCADSTASEVDQEVQKLLSSCFEQAKALLREHRALLDEIALYLLQKETITGDEFMVYVNAENRKLEAPKDEAEASGAEAAPAEDAADKTDENPNPTEGA